MKGMEVTRRYETGVVLVCLLAGSAWLFDRPLLLVGAAGIGASLLVQQYRFVRDVLATTDDLTLTQSLSRNRVSTDEELSVAVRAALPEPWTFDDGRSAATGDRNRPRPEEPMASPRRRGGGSDDDVFASLAGRREVRMCAADRDAHRPSRAFPLDGADGGRRERDRCAAPPSLAPRRHGWQRDVHRVRRAQNGRQRCRSRPGRNQTVRAGRYGSADRLEGDRADGQPHVREFDAETDLSTALVVDTPVVDGRPVRRGRRNSITFGTSRSHTPTTHGRTRSRSPSTPSVTPA